MVYVGRQTGIQDALQNVLIQRRDQSLLRSFSSLSIHLPFSAVADFTFVQGHVDCYMEIPSLQTAGEPFKYKNTRDSWKQLQTAGPLDITDLLEDSLETSNSHCEVKGPEGSQPPASLSGLKFIFPMSGNAFLI